MKKSKAKILKYFSICIVLSFSSLLFLWSPIIFSKEKSVDKNIESENKVANSHNDFIEITKLVLENTRDQTNLTTGFIQYGITIIVAFFTIGGTVCMLIGLNKVNDLKQQAQAELSVYKERLSLHENEARRYKEDFEKKMQEISASMHVELDSQIELLAARAEIDHATSNQSNIPKEAWSRFLHNACKRIEVVLENEKLSSVAKIRGLADLGYAKKRLGDFENAYFHLDEAAKLAKNETIEMYALTAYNAACYAAITKNPSAEKWLNEAINSKEKYKSNASVDSDFSEVKETDWFKRLTA